MEFSEKLQYLRKQRHLTQEQLAEKLYVSRTAVSKWESGKGYPNLDSLKCISSLFGVSIDDLLSGEELITAAQTENRVHLQTIRATVTGFLDLFAAACIFLPLYGNPGEGHIRAVNLFAFTAASPGIRALAWLLLLMLSLLGITELLLVRMKKDACIRLIAKVSLALSTIAILFFALIRTPYALTLLFLFFLVKLFLICSQSRTHP